MPDQGGAQASARPGRCANHPGVAEIGSCEVCGRALCATCAVPVRGRVIGPECLRSVLEEFEEQPMPAPPASSSRRSDLLVVAGFASVVVLSIFPWSRFGDSSRFLGAWTRHWSLVASLAGVAGLAVTLLFGRRLRSPVLESSVLAALALTVTWAALRHHSHPPPLSVGSLAPYLAALGGLVAFLGAAAKVVSALRGRRSAP